MTPQFTTPCFVRIEDAAKRKEVCEKLEQIGYRNTWHSTFKNKILVTTTGGDFLDVVSIVNRSMVDGGDNIAPFLALAGMRSDTDMGQWFVCEESYTDPMLDYQIIEVGTLVKQGEFDQYAKAFHRRATAAEIIEHFNRQTK